MSDNIVNFKRRNKNQNYLDEIIDILTNGLEALQFEHYAYNLPPAENEEVLRFVERSWKLTITNAILTYTTMREAFTPDTPPDIALVEFLDRLDTQPRNIAFHTVNTQTGLRMTIVLTNIDGVYYPVNGWLHGENLHVMAIQNYAKSNGISYNEALGLPELRTPPSE